MVVYISKFPLNYLPNKSGIFDSSCKYSPIIATEIAKELGVETSENFIGRKSNMHNVVLSKYFLRPNEELINFYEDPEESDEFAVQDNKEEKPNPYEKISNVFNELDRTLRLRNYPNDQIEKVKFDFLKQEFLAKLIGLCDQKGDNTTLIISMDEDRKKRVRLAPMYDYDFSFNVVKGNGFRKRCADNGKTDIVSFVEQYRDYPEFLDFVKTSVNILDMEKVYENIYNDTGIKIFESSKENPDLEDDYTEFLKDRLKTDYTGFVNSNLRMIQKLLKSFEREKMGENIKSI